jgi:hypothetical protein
MLTRHKLKSLLHYNPRTGLWTNLVDRTRKNAGKRAGWINENGYVELSVSGRYYKSHRLAWFYMTGRWPQHQIDHKNTSRSDNRWNNLRVATHGQNRRNCTKYANNTSGLKGVSWHVQHGKWQAQIQIDKKKQYLGFFNTPEQAYKAYTIAAKKHFGKFARAA